ncbi:MAG TPA: monofunctional biosynthetic peptidoglycan transglycosylase [Gemmatimonadales bacterium]|nr:monofunctional biosynthetic peptidoglycan transglycosylase [Gemmatimonadales bacterium]
MGLAPVLAAVWVVVTWWSWPDVAELAQRNPATTAFMERYRARHSARGRVAEVSWNPVSYQGISVHLKRAVVAAEDLEFFSHGGFSGSEVRAALRTALRERQAPRGASTITQQLAKNLWLSPSRSPVRKLREALLTRSLERHLTKRRILELYLNVVEFGPGVYGAEAAARTYFGKPAADLLEDEAAMLAAGLPRPASWHPGVSSRAYAGYAAEIKRRMDAAGFLWRAVGAEPPAGVPVALPDLDSLLQAVRDSVVRPDTGLQDTMTVQPAPAPVDTPIRSAVL